MGSVLYLCYHRARHPNLATHLIRLPDPDTWCNHVSGFYAPSDATPDQLLDVVLIEARAGHGVTGPGHQPRTLRDAIRVDEVEVYRQSPVLASDEAAGREWVHKQIGKDYDTPGLLGFVPLTLVRNAAIKQQKRAAEAKWWCSELWQAQSPKRGRPLLINLQPYQAKPEHLRTSPLQTKVAEWKKEAA